MRDENREILDKHDPDVIVQQIVNELMEVADRARTIKADYVQARRAKDTRGLDKLLKRLPAVDLPDLIVQLTERVVGALVMSFSLAEMALDAAGDALEVAGGEDVDLEDDEQYDRDAVLRLITEESEVLRVISNYLKSLENLPEDVSAALLKIDGKVVAYDEQLALIAAEDVEESVDEPDEDVSGDGALTLVDPSGLSKTPQLKGVPRPSEVASETVSVGPDAKHKGSVSGAPDTVPVDVPTDNEDIQA